MGRDRISSLREAGVARWAWDARIVQLHGAKRRGEWSVPRAFGRTEVARGKLLNAHDSDDTLAGR